MMKIKGLLALGLLLAAGSVVADGGGSKAPAQRNIVVRTVAGGYNKTKEGLGNGYGYVKGHPVKTGAGVLVAAAALYERKEIKDALKRYGVSVKEMSPQQKLFLGTLALSGYAACKARGYSKETLELVKALDGKVNALDGKVDDLADKLKLLPTKEDVNASLAAALKDNDAKTNAVFAALAKKYGHSKKGGVGKDLFNLVEEVDGVGDATSDVEGGDE